MLQINSGKLYPNGVHRKNTLRGVLYSNLSMYGRDDMQIVTEAGTLLQVDPTGSPKPLVYEIFEQFEDDTIAPGVLVSHTIEPYIYDFAAVASFYLRIICTPDAALCARLLNGKRSIGVSTPPDKLIKRVFDKDIWLQPDDAGNLTSFVHDLLALERKSFLAAMRAIRTYVTGLHRVADDLETAYTLLVASIESLAQDFDGHVGTWADYDETKKRRLDKALVGVDDNGAERVRAALIKNEHLALARRFRDFALDHVTNAALLEPGRNGAPGRLDLRDALKEAYALRSRYVHNLKDLPRLLDVDFSHGETIRQNHATFLTLEGLARVARTVILEFVTRRPKVETEQYDYGSERYGIMSVQMASEYWIGRPEALAADSGRQWLEGFLEQYAEQLLYRKPMTDQAKVSLRMEEILPTLNEKQRLPMIAAYCLYNRIVPEPHRSPRAADTIRQHQQLFEAPSSESLLVHLILGVAPPWNLSEYRATVDRYFNERNQKRGFRAPPLFEAAMILALAELYRSVGDMHEAKSILSFAIENQLAFDPIVSRDQVLDPEVPIDWTELIPVREAEDQPAT